MSSYIQGEKELKLLFNTFYIKSNAIDIKLDIYALSNRLNINHVFQNNTTFNKYKQVIENIFIEHNVLNSDFFYDLIFDTIDNNDKPKGSYESEIISYNQYFTNGAIYNEQHFNEILKYYINVTGDKNIVEACKDIFFFVDKKYNEFYKNLSNKIDDTLVVGNIKEYKKDNEFIIAVDIEYKIYQASEKLNLIFDLGSKKIISVNKN